MVQIGELVVYGLHGVCSVLETENRTVDRKTVTYLVLEPVGQNGSRFYVPMHNENAMSKLRRMPSREELEALLKSELVRQDCWIGDENRRKQCYRELMSSSDQTGMIRMIRTLYRHRHELASVGKKFHLSDENFLRDAEKLICSEVSVIMGLEYDAAKKYFRSSILEGSGSGALPE